jgi:DNA-binding HxlR family transcriptional regulator
MAIPVPHAPECPLARAVDHVGEWWSLLILRDACLGLTRFDDFQKSLGIASNILTRRLKHLTELGLLERRLYMTRPARYDYVLTAMGRDFFPVIAAMIAWSNRHLAPEGVALALTRCDTSAPVEPAVVDRSDLTPLTLDNVVLVAGPQASPAMRDRLASLTKLRPLSRPPEAGA